MGRMQRSEVDARRHARPHKGPATRVDHDPRAADALLGGPFEAFYRLSQRQMGTTPLDRTTLGAGSHLVRVKNPAFEAWEGRIVVRPGQTERLIVDLTQNRKQ